jgi:hypothetical protein
MSDRIRRRFIWKVVKFADGTERRAPSRPVGNGSVRAGTVPGVPNSTLAQIWIGRTIIRKTENARRLFPLLTGAGQGEGTLAGFPDKPIRQAQCQNHEN